MVGFLDILSFCPINSPLCSDMDSLSESQASSWSDFTNSAPHLPHPNGSNSQGRISSPSPTDVPSTGGPSWSPCPSWPSSDWSPCPSWPSSDWTPSSSEERYIIQWEQWEIASSNSHLSNLLGDEDYRPPHNSRPVTSPPILIPQENNIQPESENQNTQRIGMLAGNWYFRRLLLADVKFSVTSCKPRALGTCI